MKDNYVILDEIAYENGAYETIINTAIGTFKGYTEPDEADSKYPSIYHASEIALTKALRKFAEAATAQLKREIKLLQSMIKQSIDFAIDGADIDNSSFRILNGTLKQKKKDLELWEKRRNALTISLTNRIAARDKIVAGYIKKDKKD